MRAKKATDTSQKNVLTNYFRKSPGKNNIANGKSPSKSSPNKNVKSKISPKKLTTTQVSMANGKSVKKELNSPTALKNGSTTRPRGRPKKTSSIDKINGSIKKRGRPHKSKIIASSLLQCVNENNNNNNNEVDILKINNNNNIVNVKEKEIKANDGDKNLKKSGKVHESSLTKSHKSSKVLNISDSLVGEEESNNKPIRCNVCNEVFPNRYYQRKHRLRDHEDQVYECRICSFNSVDPEKLKSHLMRVHIGKKDKELSDSVSHSYIELDNMNDMFDKKVPRKVVLEDGVALGRDVISKLSFICDLCGRGYSCRYSLERHMRCHTLERPFSCKICDFTSSYQEHINRHMINVHLIVNSNEPRLKYSEIKKIKKEMESAENEEENPDDDTEKAKPKKRLLIRKRFECAVCGLKSTHKRKLADHIRNRHPNAHIESLDNNDGSKVHLIVTVPKNRKYKDKLTITCPWCSLIFHDNWKYKVHMRSHTGIKPFRCSVCSMKASSKMTIRDHVHRKHRDVKDAKIILNTVSIDGNEEVMEIPVPWREFNCNICNKQMEDNYQLKKHKLQEHPDAVPFACAICDFRSLSKTPLILHCSQEHPNESLESLVRKNGKSFKVGPVNLPTCDICNKVFGYQSQLNIHYKLHTGERSLNCANCHYKTNNKKELENHMNKVHFGLKTRKKRTTKKMKK